MTETPATPATLVLGVGNILLSDEGVGVRVVEHLQQTMATRPDVSLVDGGTRGLTLLPLLEDAARVVVIDAAHMDAPAGTVRVLEGADMDSFVRQPGRTSHDVGLGDMTDALAIRDLLPGRRALVAVQAANLDLGQTLSAPVAAAVAEAARQVKRLLDAWAADPPSTGRWGE